MGKSQSFGALEIERNKGKWVGKEWSEELRVCEWLWGQKKGRGIEGQEAVMKMGKMEIILPGSAMELSDRLRRYIEKSLTLSFSLEAKKELFHSYHYRLGAEVWSREKDIGRALLLSWKIQGTEDIKVEMALKMKTGKEKGRRRHC